MEKSDKNLSELLELSYLLYMKNDKINAEKTPKFGSITFNYQDGKLQYIEKKETIK